MRNDYSEIAGLLALATDDGAAAIDITSRVVGSDGRAGDDAEKNIVSIPANLDRKEVESIGIVILDELPETREEREKSFVRVRIPEGWTVVTSTDDHRQRYILDTRGVRRLSMSDNEQFWDRYVATSVVRQGYEVPLQLCYGEGTLETAHWTELSDDEKAEAIEGLRRNVAKGVECPNIYGDVGVKAQGWLDKIAKLS